MVPPVGLSTLVGLAEGNNNDVDDDSDGDSEE